MNQIKLILFMAAFLTAFHNLAFFRNVINTYAGVDGVAAMLISLAVVLCCVLVVLLSALSPGRLLKPVLILLLLVSSVTAYFTDTYNAIIDSTMIDNMILTDVNEMRDLISPRLLAYFALLGALPSYFVYRTQLTREGIGRSFLSRIGLIVLSLLTATAMVFLSSDFYASFFREHKALRYYTNPVTPFYSLVKSVRTSIAVSATELQRIGTDAAIPTEDTDRELVILIVGETARSDRFSLNGYERNTNPRLSREEVISFTNVSSCGTSTAVSVPCMFSVSGHDSFDRGESSSTENLLDVITHAGVAVLWRDNNSSSKGVADRMTYEDYKSPDVNPICDPECRDEGMLDGLSEWIEQQTSQDILIVLHQMGSHGPAYYKRYPTDFEKYRPVCRTNQLDQCSDEEIGNTYDNTILYTDYFLSKVINLLKQKSDTFETAMLYFSDHGESLGEAGMYLHGMPYLFAPETQTRIPAILWIGPKFEGLDVAAIRATKDQAFSHDNIFHMLIGLMEIQTDAYDPDQDMLLYTDAEPWRKPFADKHKTAAAGARLPAEEGI